MPVLPDAEISAALPSLSGWRRESDLLVRDFVFPNFADAMIFLNKVAEAAEEMDHHPDIDIRYNKVRMALTSHDSGGITRRDLKMARRINEISGD